ncbi:MAG: hypothetical protein LBL58_19050 [Tannerellaceae bacterium]|jgi:hypothetical protein|nr:hypothetical protein [Tannerellaceae bacterium]
MSTPDKTSASIGYTDPTGKTTVDIQPASEIYRLDGIYEGQRTDGKNGIWVGSDHLRNLDGSLITKDEFINNSATIYGESAATYGIIDKYEFFAIASAHKRNSIAYGKTSIAARDFKSLLPPEARNQKDGMKYAIAAEINALNNGHDYSNGAKQWDGAEQAYIEGNDSNITNNAKHKILYKINVMGWDISDEHFNSWKNAITKIFGAKKFNVPQKKYAVANYQGMTNKDRIRLKSSAQYGLTIFWTEVDIIKP